VQYLKKTLKDIITELYSYYHQTFTTTKQRYYV